jgi:outer membrane lipopolysaccharide assembly protein LptE/RlpB
MVNLNVILKSERIARVLRELGVEEEYEVTETSLKEFTVTNYHQLDTNLSKEERINEVEMLEKDIEAEMLEKDILDRILKEGKEVMLKIVDRAYSDAYYGYDEDKIVI